MSKTEKTLRLILLDDEAGLEDTKIFGRDCRQGFTEIDGVPLKVHSLSDPDVFLEQLTRGEVQADALLLDINFSHFAEHRANLSWADPPVSTREWWGVDVLRTVKRIDPDFPVIVLTALPGQSLSFTAGRFGADDFVSKSRLQTVLAPHDSPALVELHRRIVQAIDTCRRRSVYDHEHLVAADLFAETYDVEECSKVATVAYYHFENERISELVDRLAREVALPQKRRLSILDLGCGTGRIETCLANHPMRGHLDVAAVDFSGHMLRSAYSKLRNREDVCRATFGRRSQGQEDAGRLSVSFYRATAEHLDTFRQRYAEGFDLAILGFGFLSYVRYGHVLPAAVQTEARSGLAPLMKEDGVVLFSVYNEESAIYRRLSVARRPNSSQDLPIAAIMELESGRLRVGEGRYFECEAFTKSRMARLLAQAGFVATPDEFATFPTLHLALDNSQSSTFAPDNEFCGGMFDPRLYAYDKQISALFENQGHYIVGQAVKRTKRDQ